MAERVVFHIGPPKTGTSYLQTILWRNEAVLREHGVLLPGSLTDQRWGSLEVRGDPRLRHRPAGARGAWSRVVREVRDWPGTAVLSHEFYAAASTEQARRALQDLGADEVHLVLTAREPLGVLTAAWQETLKYGSTTALDDFALGVSDSPAAVWDWRTLDVCEVLDRWGGLVPADRVHVLPASAVGASRDELWWRFAGLLPVDASRLSYADVFDNRSMGLVECELVRRVAAHLERPGVLHRSTWVRKYLAETLLVPRGRERFLPSAGRVEECRVRGERAVRSITERGYDVRGDLELLRVPDPLPARRTPQEVTDAEVLAAAAPTLARMLLDQARTAKERNRARRRVDDLERRLAEAEAELEALRARSPRRRLGTLARSLRPKP